MTTLPTNEISRKKKSTPKSTAVQLSDKEVTSTAIPPVLPSTSKNVAAQSASVSVSANRYMIPKKGIQSNKLNELAVKVSPPARPILPKQPSINKTSPPRNISGNRSTQGQKKKKKTDVWMKYSERPPGSLPWKNPIQKVVLFTDHLVFRSRKLSINIKINRILSWVVFKDKGFICNIQGQWVSMLMESYR